MAETSIEMQAYNSMNRKFATWGFITLVISSLAFAFAFFMFFLGTPPNSLTEGEQYRLWMIDHQEQFINQEAGLFYWTEIHTAIFSAGLAVVTLVVSLYLFQLLLVSRIAKVAAKAFASN